MTRGLSKSLRNYLITGALILIPIAVTIYIIVSGFLFIDRFLSGVVTAVFGRRIPGAGAVLTAVFTIAVGMVATNVFGRRLISFGEQLLIRIPIVSVVYSGIKQLLEAFTVQNRGGFKRVVLVEFPRRDIWSVGFLTNEMDWTEFDDRLVPDMVSVFVPTAPNPTTGFLLLLSREDVIVSNMSVEQAFKMIISGGIVDPAANGVEH